MMDTLVAGNSRPLVHFSEPLTSESCISLVDRIRRLRDDFFYSEVQLRLSSPGGEVTALEYYETAIRGLRKEGFTIDTHAVTRVSSAAAVMLSLGDERTAHPKAALLYHTGRVAGVDGALTARGAASIADALGSVDSEVIGLLAERAARSPCPAGDTPRERFSVADWQAIVRLAPGNAKRPNTVLLRFRRRVAAAFDGGQEKLRDLFTEFCVLDAPISPYLAVELGLIDQVGDGEREAAAQADDPGLTIPEWGPLYPGGLVPRSALTRHTLILGETGSGKTQSAILPMLSAILPPSAPVSCALVIDPKHELLPAVERMADPSVRVRRLQPGVDTLDLMAGSRSVAGDVAAGRWMTAARKMLVRSSGFAHSAARVLAGKVASSPRNLFWEAQGSQYAVAALAFSLFLSQEGRLAKVLGAIPERMSRTRRKLASFGEYAGLISARRHKTPVNALAVARRALDEYLSDPGDVLYLLEKFCGKEPETDEEDDLRREIRYRGSTQAADQMFVSVLAEARSCLDPYADGAATKTLLFGVEGVTPTVDFSAAVDAEGERTIYVLQPEDAGADSMIARATKAMYFESILGSPLRRRRGGEMPLVFYVADEFHRFITSDESHGEQSFLDRARSFGAGCLVATQAVSSVTHSLSVAREPAVATAVKLLLVNTGTKMVFRSTEPDVRNLLDSVSPGTGPNRVTALRPPSSLRPGECYASLPDGRFERRQLKPLDLSRVAR